MPPLKAVPTLLDLTIEGVSDLVELEAYRLAEYVVTHFKYEELEQAVRGMAQNQVNNYFLFCHKVDIKLVFRKSKSIVIRCNGV